MHNLEMVSIESPRIREIQATIKDKDIENKYKCIEAFMELLLHICVHLTLLSLLEPILFFNYVIGMEKDLFFDQIKSLVDLLTHHFKDEEAQEIRSENFYTLFIEFLSLKSPFITEILFLMYSSSNLLINLTLSKDSGELFVNESNIYKELFGNVPLYQLQNTLLDHYVHFD